MTETKGRCMQKEGGYGGAERGRKDGKTAAERAMIEVADRNKMTILTEFNHKYDWQALRTTKPPPIKKSSGGFICVHEPMDSGWGVKIKAGAGEDGR